MAIALRNVIIESDRPRCDTCIPLGTGTVYGDGETGETESVSHDHVRLLNNCCVMLQWMTVIWYITIDLMVGQRDLQEK